MTRHPIATRFLAGMEGAVPGTQDHDSRLRQGMVTALHDISGISAMRTVLKSARRGESHATLEIAMEGWSPTLHRLSMSETMAMHGRPCEDATAMLERLAGIIGTMAFRADAGALLGHRLPMANDMDAAVDHLHIDRGLAQMLATPAACLNGARSAVASTHKAGTAPGHFINHVSSRWARGVERTWDGATIREIGWNFTVPGAGDATYDGLVLSLKAPEVPATVVAALPGRRLRDLALVHRAIDDRVVRSIHVEPWDGAVNLYSLTFEPDYMPLAGLSWDDLRMTWTT